jgi:hypothetical protein
VTYCSSALEVQAFLAANAFRTTLVSTSLECIATWSAVGLRSTLVSTSLETECTTSVVALRSCLGSTTLEVQAELSGVGTRFGSDISSKIVCALIEPQFYSAVTALQLLEGLVVALPAVAAVEVRTATAVTSCVPRYTATSIYSRSVCAVYLRVFEAVIEPVRMAAATEVIDTIGCPRVVAAPPYTASVSAQVYSATSVQRKSGR